MEERASFAKRMTLSLPVLLGTRRRGRKSAAVARYVAERLDRQPDIGSRVWDTRELPFGDLEEREWEMAERPAWLVEFVGEMARADGFVIVSPEYNYGYPGALKNMLDALYDEWNRKPFALVGTGGISGGIRMMDNLRQVISGLGGVTVPFAVPVPFVMRAFGEDGPRADRDEWGARFDKLGDELAWYARALKAQRERPQPPSEGRASAGASSA